MSALAQVSAQAEQKPALSAFQDPRSLPTPPLNGREKEVEKPFQLEEITRALHVYRPAPLHTNEKTGGALGDIIPPRVVLLLGWMDAPLSLLVKYAKPYAALLPQATIFIVLCNGRSYMNTDKSSSLRTLHHLLLVEAQKEDQRRKMREEMGRVESTRSGLRLDVDLREKDQKQLDESTFTLVENENETERMKPIDDRGPKEAAPPPSASPSLPAQPHGILIHSFSDGGANNLSQILRSSSLSLIPRATILDSSPSQGRPWEGATAFTMPLAAKSRPWLVRVLLRQSMRFTIYFVFRLVLLVLKLKGKKSRNARMRSALNDTKLWPNKAVLAQGEKVEQSLLPPRLYLYSKADALVPYQAIEAHARECAEAQNLSPAKVVEMEGSDAKKQGEEKVNTLDAEEKIVLRRWNEAPHCAIGRYDSAGYWGEVKTFLTRHLS